MRRSRRRSRQRRIDFSTAWPPLAAQRCYISGAFATGSNDHLAEHCGGELWGLTGHDPFLIAAGLFAAWVLSLWVHPFCKCWRCRGRRVVIRSGCRMCRLLLGDGKRKRKPPRAVTCPACKGIGRQQRRGSRTVHQLARRVGRELARSRNPRRIERTDLDAHRNL